MPDRRASREDEALLAAAVAGIERLNATHGEAPGGGARFLIFHRERRWNESERRWMGWERKRGKLHELNALLRGSTTTSIITTGRPSSQPPAGVRYVITLDADTRLARGAAARLVGTMAHPLNRPSFHPRASRVIEGYGLLQPRITPTLPTEHDASIFQRVFSGSAGIDPYTSAVSDVYQDLFREGSYAGKGIYDVDAFERALAGRVPDNALLSHDLFEGTFARAGLVTDIELFEEFPSRYEESAARQHRWARGDWQLLPWIVGRAPHGPGRRRAGRMPVIARWKMVDNLRRSLVAPTTLATLVAAWSLPSVPVIGLDPVRRGRAHHPRGAAGAHRSRAAGARHLQAQPRARGGHRPRPVVRSRGPRRDVPRASGQPHGRRHRADPRSTAGHAAGPAPVGDRGAREGAGDTRPPWPLPAHGRWRPDRDRQRDGSWPVLKPEALPVAAPFVALWLLSPLVARWVSLPPTGAAARELSGPEVKTLRLAARRTWRFFETFVGPEDNALPPDNFQAAARTGVAHRTSPTNIGLYLLATVTARDLGWIGTLEMVERLEATLATIERLERHRGHLLNWYDTRDLRPLEPAYVSTVDSGNLCGHLLALASACREMLERPIPVEAATAGIGDAIDLAREAAAAVEDGRRTQTITARHLADALTFGGEAPTALPGTPDAWAARLRDLWDSAQTLSDVARAITDERGEPMDSPLVTWAEAVRRSVASHARDLELLGRAGPGWERRGRPTTPVAHLGRDAGRACAADDEARPGARPVAPPDRHRRAGPSASSPRRTSRSSTSRCGCCSRSASASVMAPSTRAATTCSRPRLASRASSPSPRATSSRATGSDSVARSRRLAAARPSSRGPGRCSST